MVLSVSENGLFWTERVMNSSGAVYLTASKGVLNHAVVSFCLLRAIEEDDAVEIGLIQESESRIGI